jgi:hypothetical protein
MTFRLFACFLHESIGTSENPITDSRTMVRSTIQFPEDDLRAASRSSTSANSPGARLGCDWSRRRVRLSRRRMVCMVALPNPRKDRFLRIEVAKASSAPASNSPRHAARGRRRYPYRFHGQSMKSALLSPCTPLAAAATLSRHSQRSRAVSS